MRTFETPEQQAEYDKAYAEGYAAKYNELTDRENHYPEGSPGQLGFDDGYHEACLFA